jgi:hypothetical protein
VIVERLRKAVTSRWAELLAWLRNDHIGLLGRLQFSLPAEGPLEEGLERLRLAPNLLLLAEIDHEREYELSRAVAEHLLGGAGTGSRRGRP